MYEAETIKDAVLFLIEQNKKALDPAEMIAVLYVADIYHLILFGRTITNSIKDTKYMLMDTDDMQKLCEEVEGTSSNYIHLSETDKDALEFALSRRQMDGFQSVPMCFGIKE